MWWFLCTENEEQPILVYAYVLTAAHCVDGINKTEFTIYLGSYDISMPVQSYEQEFSVTEVFIHDDYKSDNNPFAYDIALLRLDRIPDKTESVDRGKLARDEVNFNANGTVIGWGHTSEGGNPSSVLQQVVLQIQTDAECSSSMGAQYSEESMFCAGPPGGGQDACTGDSGSPFMVVDGGVRISGLVSWGVGCGRPGKYGVYSDVRAGRRFINRTLRKPRTV